MVATDRAPGTRLVADPDPRPVPLDGALTLSQALRVFVRELFAKSLSAPLVREAEGYSFVISTPAAGDFRVTVEPFEHSIRL